MKLLTRMAAIACGSAISCGVTVAAYRSVVAQRVPTQLTAAQVRLLESLDINVAVPTNLPENFEVSIVRAEILPRDGGSKARYAIFYRGPNNTCFAIESLTGGSSDPELEASLPINSALFGNGYRLHYGKFRGSDHPGRYLFSDWMEKDGEFYRLAGTGVREDTATNGGCNNLSPEAAVRVIESLEFLSP